MGLRLNVLERRMEQQSLLVREWRDIRWDYREHTRSAHELAELTTSPRKHSYGD